MITNEHIRFRRLTQTDKKAMLAIAAKIWEGDDYLAKVYDKWISISTAPFVGIFSGERLVGCGRLSPLNRRIGWLEGLRIDPDQQRRGLGKLVAIEMIRLAREQNFSELLFSTYFDNYGSIAINERFGFKRIATYTTLNLKLADLTEETTDPVDPRDPAGAADPEVVDVGVDVGVEVRVEVRVEVTSGLPQLAETIWNGWVFLPPETEDMAAYFPAAETVSCGESLFVVAANNKSPEAMDEICWLTEPESDGARYCLAYAINRCRRLGKERLHLMLPEALPIQPFYDAGFTVYEREKDVFVYRGIVNELLTD